MLAASSSRFTPEIEAMRDCAASFSSLATSVKRVMVAIFSPTSVLRLW
ncbi:Uncharacterised protein [Vibrio cholerae]|nr:Uncharacterised protein [Vibrio cholerae]